MKQNLFRNITAPLTCAVIALHAGLAAFPVNAVETDETVLTVAQETEEFSLYKSAAYDPLYPEKTDYFMLNGYDGTDGTTVTFTVADESVAAIVQSDNTFAKLEGVGCGETTLTAVCSDGRTASIAVSVEKLREYEYDQYHVSASTTEAKLEYLLGEELDLSGVCIFGGYGMNDYSILGDIFGEELPSLLERNTFDLSVDTSAFDNTKMGIYPIEVHFGYAADTFTVTVTDGTDIVIQGDVNCDDSVDLLDVLALNKNLLVGEKLSEYGMINADVDRDGSTNSLDALNILKYTIAVIEEFPD